MIRRWIIADIGVDDDFDFDSAKERVSSRIDSTGPLDGII